MSALDALPRGRPGPLGPDGPCRCGGRHFAWRRGAWACTTCTPVPGFTGLTCTLPGMALEGRQDALEAIQGPGAIPNPAPVPSPAPERPKAGLVQVCITCSGTGACPLTRDRPCAVCQGAGRIRWERTENARGHRRYLHPMPYGPQEGQEAAVGPGAGLDRRSAEKSPGGPSTAGIGAVGKGGAT